MSTTVGEPALSAYAAKRCPVVTQLDILAPDRKLPLPDAVQLRVQAGAVFEDDLLDSMRPPQGGGWVRIGEGDYGTMAERTLQALHEPVASVVENSVLPTVDRRSGKPDLLVRHADGWIPIDVKHHRTLDEDPAATTTLSPLHRPSPSEAKSLDGFGLRRHQGDALQLAHYRRMLQSLNLAADSPLAGIVGRERFVAWYDLDEPMWRTPAKTNRKQAVRTSMERYDFEFDFRLDILESALRGDRLVEPMRIADCATCVYRGECGPMLEADSGDASLLPGIRYSHWRALRDLDIRTRADVADLHHPTAALTAAGVAVEDWLSEAHGHALSRPLEEINKQRRKQLKTLAGAGILTAGDLAALDPTTAQLGGWAAKPILEARAATLPEPVHRWPTGTPPCLRRADVEVDIDMENTDDGVYLWGCLLNDTATSTSEYVPFVDWNTLTPDVEWEIFERFWTWLTQLRTDTTEAGRSFATYVWYEPAEKTRLRRISRNTALEEAVDELVASDDWIDLRDAFASGWTTGGSTSLKAIAPLAGFTWDVDDPGGDLSMVKHAEAVSADPALADAARSWLLTYNKGDVGATRAIREWINRESHLWPELRTD